MLTGDEWKKIQTELNGPWGMVDLRVDHFERVQLRIRRYSELRYCICVFVNGAWRHNLWDGADCEERRRFCRKIVTHLYKGKDRSPKIQKLRKHLGMNSDPTSEVFLPIWLSFRPLKRQLIATSKEIQLLAIGAECLKEEQAA